MARTVSSGRPARRSWPSSSAEHRGQAKSTLIKVLGGAHRPDSGRVKIDGHRVDLSKPTRARAAGIAVIYQEFSLVPNLTAAENLFLGREPTRRGAIDRGAERRRARELFDRLGMRIDCDVPCHTLSLAEQQVVEIAKALATDARVLVMDEPTTTLTSPEIESLFAIIRELRDRGIGIIYISHRLDEIPRVADRVMILRDGGHVLTRDVGDLCPTERGSSTSGRSFFGHAPSTREAETTSHTA